MKLQATVYVTEVEGEYVAVATGKAAKSFSGMIRMNGTAAFVVQALQKRTSRDKLIEKLKGEYEVTDEAAARNVDGILEKLRTAGWLDE